MANEIQTSFTPGKVVYALVFNDRNGQVWNTSGGTGAFEFYLTLNLSSYNIPMAGIGAASSFYQGNFPLAIPAGVYGVVAKNQQGGSPAESDPTIATGDINWSISGVVSVSDLATSGQIAGFLPTRLTRSWAVPNFGIYLKSAADHVTPFVSGLVSGIIARDGGSFVGLQSGQFTETGQGFYNLQALTSGDLACNTAKLLFTATGISGGTSDPLPMSIVLQRVSGQ